MSRCSRSPAGARASRPATSMPRPRRRRSSSYDPRIAIPIHWGTFAPFYRRRAYDLDAGERFAARARIVAPEVEVRVLRVGERTPI